MLRGRLRCAGAAGVCAMVVAGSAGAAPELWVSDSGGRIGRIDVATGTVLQIVDVGTTMTDIAFDADGALYGVSFTSLYLIDLETADSTFLGGHGISGGNALVFGLDGTLYGAGASSADLYEIDPSTGASMIIGKMGVASAGDLAFNDDAFYLSSDTGALILVDPATGAASAVGPMGINDVYGLATAENGVTYAVSGTSIYSIDLGTGLASFVSSYGGQGLTTAYGSSFFAEAVPAPGAFAVLAAVGIGLAGRRRR